MRKKAYKQMDSDADAVWKRLQAAGGRLPFGDKSAPERIKEEFGISKAAFKRALGHLLKEGKIRVAEEEIEAL